MSNWDSFLFYKCGKIKQNFVGRVGSSHLLLLVEDKDSISHYKLDLNLKLSDGVIVNFKVL